MRLRAAHARPRNSRFEPEAEVVVRQLRLPVGPPRGRSCRAGAGCPGRSDARRGAPSSDGHHAGAGALASPASGGRQRPVPEVVDAELHLEAIGSLPLRQRHQPRVVDQDVDPIVLGEDLLCGGRDRLLRAEVQIDQLEIGARSLGPISATARAAFCWLRTAMTTRAPFAANTFAVCRPKPPLAPVTTAVCPLRSGTESGCMAWSRSSVALGIPA